MWLGGLSAGKGEEGLIVRVCCGAKGGNQQIFPPFFFQTYFLLDEKEKCPTNFAKDDPEKPFGEFAIISRMGWWGSWLVGRPFKALLLSSSSSCYYLCSSSERSRRQKEHYSVSPSYTAYLAPFRVSPFVSGWGPLKADGERQEKTGLEFI